MVSKGTWYIFIALTLVIGFFSCEKNEEFIEENIQIIEKDFFLKIGTDSTSYIKTYAYFCEYEDGGTTHKEIRINNKEDFPEITLDESELGDFSIYYHEADGLGCTFFKTIIAYNGGTAKAHADLFDGEKVLSQADFERITGSLSGELFVHDTILFTFTSLGDFTAEFDVEVTSDCL